MRESRTHFEQVPLEIVRKVVEEREWREGIIEQGEAPKTKKKKVTTMRTRSKGKRGKSSQAEADKGTHEKRQ